MKKILGTVLTVCLVLSLLVLSFVLDNSTFSENQQQTFRILLVVCLCGIVYCFIAGEITHNYSQMDKLWSLLPIAYLWIIALRDSGNVRLLLYALLVTAWGIRLTVNFGRKGAYRLKFWEGNEDYRWAIVRRHPVFNHKLLWSAFDLFFISGYQNLLVLSICLPAVACMGSSLPLSWIDLLAVVLSLAFLILETVSDENMWKFQQTKKEMLEKQDSLSDLPKPYDLGFATQGPWSRMRHPNYLGEQGFWISLYLFAIGAGAAVYGIFHRSLAGPLLLVLLFIGSSTLGEKISSGKYPKYKDYIDQVCKYLPLRKYTPDSHS